MNLPILKQTIIDKKSKIFDQIIEEILFYEGGYIDHPNDNGGETKFGISKNSYPELDIMHLSISQAKKIYLEDFWLSYRYSEIENLDLAFKVLEIAINCGQPTAIKILQRAIKAVLNTEILDDGMYGDITSSAVTAICSDDVELKKLLVALKCEQASYYRAIVAENHKLQYFLKGWLKRAYHSTLLPPISIHPV